MSEDRNGSQWVHEDGYGGPEGIVEFFQGLFGLVALIVVGIGMLFTRDGT